MSTRTRNPRNEPAPQAPPPRKKISSLPLIIAAVAVAALVAIAMLQRPGRGVADEKMQADAGSGEQAPRSSAQTIPVPPGDAPPPPDPLLTPDSASAETTAPAAPPEPEPEQNAKIGYHVDNFRAYKTDLSDYTLDGVVLTNDGIELARKDDPKTSRTEDGFRRGVVESPTLPMEHASNAIQPIWRAKLPNSETSLRVEIALSGDGQNWSKWYQIEPTSDDIEPYYPDGRPNPNYGGVSGNIVSNGLRMFPFFRYRVTMSSTEEQSSPVLEEFKVTYVDSTAGQGFLHGVETPAQPEATPAQPYPTPTPAPPVPAPEL